MKVVNIQPIEKLSYRDDGLEVHSVFKTIQGEGPFTGRPAIFIRLAGCNLQCPGCDTTYTSSGVRFISNEQIAEFVEIITDSESLIVITGGEPFRQNISPLTSILLTRGYDVQIETNGTLPPPPEFPYMAHVVVSPKIDKVHPAVENIACCFKYVLSHDSVDETDGLPISVLRNKVVNKVARTNAVFPHDIYVQPADSGDISINELNVQAALDSCMKYGYRFQLQLHKVIGVE